MTQPAPATPTPIRPDPRDTGPERRRRDPNEWVALVGLLSLLVPLALLWVNAAGPGLNGRWFLVGAVHTIVGCACLLQAAEG